MDQCSPEPGAIKIHVLDIRSHGGDLIITMQLFISILPLSFLIVTQNCYDRIPGTRQISPCSLELVWLISRTFSANEQYFSFIPNQPIVLSAMAYQPNKPRRTGRIPVMNTSYTKASISYSSVTV